MMEMRLGNQVMNVQVTKNTCDKCAHCDWTKMSKTYFPTCTVSGKSVAVERDHDGACTRDGLNYSPKG